MPSSPTLPAPAKRLLGRAALLAGGLAMLAVIGSTLWYLQAARNASALSPKIEAAAQRATLLDQDCTRHREQPEGSLNDSLGASGPVNMARACDNLMVSRQEHDAFVAERKSHSQRAKWALGALLASAMIGVAAWVFALR